MRPLLARLFAAKLRLAMPAALGAKTLLTAAGACCCKSESLRTPPAWWNNSLQFWSVAVVLMCHRPVLKQMSGRICNGWSMYNQKIIIQSTMFPKLQKHIVIFCCSVRISLSPQQLHSWPTCLASAEQAISYLSSKESYPPQQTSCNSLKRLPTVVQLDLAIEWSPWTCNQQ